jgi:arylsulfatase A-like enzyme
MSQARSSVVGRIVVPTFVAAVLACASVGCHESSAVPDHADQAATARRPNIVFLLADDMRWDATSYAGNAVVRTPNLDALANAGVSFQNAYVTTPICAISRASIFMGQYARRHGILDFTQGLSPAALSESYPALLREAGYRTGFIGKFGVGNVPPAALFDFWRGFAGQGFYETTDSAGHAIHLTRLMTEQAVEFLENQSGDVPFALSVSYKAPHVQDGDDRQYIPESADRTMYTTVSIAPPATADDTYWAGLPEFFRTNNEGRARWYGLFGTPEKYQESVKGYYRMVNGLDRSVGKIVETLRRRGLDQNTVIIFTSDNGFLLGEHGLSHKWYGFEPSVRVPMVIYDPRATANNRRANPSIALNIDIAPTLLDLAGVPVPAGMQGRSLVPIMHGATGDERADFLFEHLYPLPSIKRSSGVVGGQFKYLRYLDPDPNYEVLYDLSSDPLETTNVASIPAYGPILDSLRRRHQALIDHAH